MAGGLTIAVLKASLVVLVFMHVIHSSAATRAVILVTVFWLVGVLLALSTILVLTTVFPSIDVGRVALVLGVLVGAGTVAAAAWGVRVQARLASVPRMSREERASWRMPALALLQRPPWSVVRRVAMVALSGYLVLTILMLIVRAIQIALKPFS